MFFDTHAHYDDKAFDEDRETLLQELQSVAEHILIPGCDIASSRAASQIAQKYDFVSFAAGLHPEEINTALPGWENEILTLAGHKKCVAIGEIGLDYYWDDTQKERQQEIFETQLTLAEQLDLPVIIHDREAHGDCMNIIRRHPNSRGVFHCYSGSSEMASELLRKGWYLGFDGPVTYKNARKALEVLKICPVDRMLLETDSPYLSPVPLRGKRNDSRNLRYVADQIAAVKQMTREEVERITLENGKKLFKI